MPYQSADDAKRAGLRAFWIVLAVLAVARLATYGMGSPWVDELNNWQTAEITGFHLREGAHGFTYILQNLGLLLSDSLWGLRLYAALFGIGAAALCLRWLATHGGVAHVVAGGVLFLLSPFWLFYSSDANHYAPMLFAGGVLLHLASALRREGVGWGWVAGGIVILMLLCGFHPIGLLPLFSAFILIYLFFLVNADLLPPQNTEKKKKAVGWLLLGLLVTLSALRFSSFLEWLGDRSGGALIDSLKPGLDLKFYGYLLADLFGSIFQHYSSDIILGIIGLVVSVTAWVSFGRSEARWPGLAALATSIAILLPFAIIRTPTYFYPKFMAPVVPLFLTGIAWGVGDAVRRIRASRHFSPHFIPYFLFLALFLWRGEYYLMINSRTDYQSTYQLVEFIERKTEENAVITTRDYFSSRAFRFLWERKNRGGRTHLALTSIDRCGAPALQQIAEFQATHNRPVYFVSLLETRERFAEDFAEFLDNECGIVSVFESLAHDDFVPLERDITLYRILPRDDSVDIFALPRSGARPTAILGEKRVTGLGRAGGAQLRFPNQTGAAYRFRTETPLDSLTIPFSWSSKKNRPTWVFFAINDSHAFAYDAETSGLDLGTIRLNAPIQPGEHTLYFYVNSDDGVWMHQSADFVPGNITAEPVSDGETIILEPLESLVTEGGGEFPLRFTAEAWGDGVFRRESFDLDRAIPANTTFFAMQKVRLGGLPDRGAAFTVYTAPKTRAALNKAAAFTYDWTMCAVATSAEKDLSSIESAITDFRMHNRRIVDPVIEAEAIRVFGNR